MSVELKDEIKDEIENVRRRYAIIKDYLSGAEYELSEVKGCLHEIKEGLSRIWALYYLHTMKQGKPVSLPTRDILDYIDVALTLMEANPDLARLALQFSLTLSRVKIEDLMAALDILSRLI
ncbi:MAG: hypothetical protein QW105_02450 [Nitrososphaerota archaeon]